MSAHNQCNSTDIGKLQGRTPGFVARALVALRREVSVHAPPRARRVSWRPNARDLVHKPAMRAHTLASPKGGRLPEELSLSMMSHLRPAMLIALATMNGMTQHCAALFSSPTLPDSPVAWLQRHALLVGAWTIASFLIFRILPVTNDCSHRGVAASAILLAGCAFLLGGIWGFLTGDWLPTFLPGTVVSIGACVPMLARRLNRRVRHVTFEQPEVKNPSFASGWCHAEAYNQLRELFRTKVDCAYAEAVVPLEIQVSWANEMSAYRF
jgi:hypothetical protein